CVAFAHGHEDDEAAEELTRRGFEIVTAPYNHRWATIKSLPTLLGEKPLTLTFYSSAALQEAVDRFAPSSDLVYAFSSSMGAFLQNHPNTIRIMHFAELDSDKWRQYAEFTPWPKRWVYAREARTLRKLEQQL